MIEMREKRGWRRGNERRRRRPFFFFFHPGRKRERAEEEKREGEATFKFAHTSVRPLLAFEAEERKRGEEGEKRKKETCTLRFF